MWVSFFARSPGRLEWRLTLFYSVVLTCLFVGLGFYLEAQLTQLAGTQLQDQLLTRAATFPGGSVPPRGRGRSLFRLPASGDTPTRPLDFSGSLSLLAAAGVAGDAGGVSVTVLNPDGTVVPRPNPTDGWQPVGSLSPALLEAALTGKPAGPSRVAGAQDEWFVLDVPITGRAGPRGVVQFAVSTAEISNITSAFRLVLVSGMATLVLLSLLLGRPLANLALRPLATLRRQISAVSYESIGERVPVPSAADEVRTLAVAFNAMLQRIEDSLATERQGQEQLRRFVEDASHELRSPVAALNGYGELLLRDAPANLQPVASQLNKEVQRMGRLVRDLLDLTRLDASLGHPPEREPLDLVEVARAVIASLGRAAGLRRVALVAPTELWIRGDPDNLERALANLVANAIQHTDSDGEIRVTVRAENGAVSIEVADDGFGIDADDLPRVFDRFYRADRARSRANGNVGLGLSIVQAIVAQHQGTVAVASRPGEGTQFTIQLGAAIEPPEDAMVDRPAHLAR